MSERPICQVPVNRPSSMPTRFVLSSLVSHQRNRVPFGTPNGGHLIRTPSLFYTLRSRLLYTAVYSYTRYTAPRTDTDTWDNGRAHGRPPDRTLTLTRTLWGDQCCVLVYTAPRTDTDTWDNGRAHGRPPDPNPNPNPNAMG